MANKTILASGPISQGSTFTDGIPMANGDVVVSCPTGLHYTIDVAISLGTPGTGTTVATDLSANNGMIIAAPLTFAGNIVNQGGGSVGTPSDQFKVMHGGSVIFDNTGANTNVIQLGGAISRRGRAVVVGLVAGDIPFTVTGAGTSTIQFNNGGFLNGGYLNFFGADFTGWGGTTVVFAIPSPDNAAGAEVTYNYCRWVSCGMLDHNATLGSAANFTMNHCSIKSTISTTAPAKFSPGVGTGLRQLTFTYIQGIITNLAPAGMTIEDCIFTDTPSTSGTVWAASWHRNWMNNTSSSAGTGNFGWNGDAGDCLLTRTSLTLDNPHFSILGKTRDMHLTGMVVWLASNAINGDCLEEPAGTNPATTCNVIVDYWLILPNGNRTEGAGNLFSAGNITANMPITLSHVTQYCGTANNATGLGETGSGYSTQCVTYDSSIFYNTLGSPASYKVNSEASSPGWAPNWCLATGYDYNCGWNLLPGLRGKGYNNSGTGVPGAHDVDVNPNFVDDTRNPLTWMKTINPALSTPTDLLALLATANDPGVTNVSTAACIAHIRLGFVPKNSAIRSAAKDGTVIGAIQTSLPPSMRGKGHRRKMMSWM